MDIVTGGMLQLDMTIIVLNGHRLIERKRKNENYLEKNK
jgi:hypothetical protein